MKALRFDRIGSLDYLKILDVRNPEPGQGSVLVRVKAAALNPSDAKNVLGRMEETTVPRTPGRDFAGVVVEGTEAYLEGTEIFGTGGNLGFSRDGSHAEFIEVPVEAIKPKPKSLTYVEAAAVPIVALTAWQALIDSAKLSAGQTVLIHGGSGGVGSFAIQIAKAHGAKVIATASTANQDLLKELGADNAVDYKKQKFEDVAKDVDVALDPIGKDTLARSYGVVKKGGFIVSIVARPNQAELDKHGIRGADRGVVRQTTATGRRPSG